MTIIVSLYSSVSSLIFIITLRGYQNRCHHSQRTKRRRNHITHNITIIVLARPDKSTFRFHNAGYNIIDQTVEVFNACCLEFILEFILIDRCKNFFETSVINLGNRILAAKPQILFRIKRIIKATSCKTCDRIIQIVHTLKNPRTFIVMNQFFSLLSVSTFKYQISISWSINVHLCILIHITVCMTCDRDRFLPVLNTWLDTLYNNRSTKYGSIKNRTNRSIRAFVHFL